MNPREEMRLGQGRRVPARVGAAIFAAAVVGACAGENLFTGPSLGAAGLLGPQVEITAPLPNVTVAAGDSVQVTANIASQDGITEVSFTGTLDAGGPAPFTPIVVPLAAVTDTTMSRYLKRSGTTGGGAKIIVTAKDVSGDTGADTISVSLGS